MLKPGAQAGPVMKKLSRTNTLISIAEAAGVSPALVSVVLSNSSSTTRVSDATRERIKKVAADLNYRPHGGARSARLKRFRTVGLVAARTFSSSVESLHPIQPELIDGVNDALLAKDYCLAFLRVNVMPRLDESNWPRLLSESRVDGLVVADLAPVELRSFIQRFELPAVWVNTNLHEATDCVYYDEVAAGREATRRLLERGHRRILFLRPPSDIHYSSRDRYQGYREEMEAWGLSPPADSRQPIPDDEFPAWLAAVMRRARRPTAVIRPAGGDPRVVTLLWHLGLRIPRDVSIVCWLNHRQLAGRFVPEHTAMVLDIYQAGRTATEMVLHRIDHAGKSIPSKTLTWEWHEGGTVGPPPAP